MATSCVGTMSRRSGLRRPLPSAAKSSKAQWQGHGEISGPGNSAFSPTQAAETGPVPPGCRPAARGRTARYAGNTPRSGAIYRMSASQQRNLGINTAFPRLVLPARGEARSRAQAGSGIVIKGSNISWPHQTASSSSAPVPPGFQPPSCCGSAAMIRWCWTGGPVSRAIPPPMSPIPARWRSWPRWAWANGSGPRATPRR